MAKLTEAQRWALGLAVCNNDVWDVLSGCHRPMLTGLVRRGLLKSTEQSEQVRGERRVYYRLYKITAAGRAALEAEKERP